MLFEPTLDQLYHNEFGLSYKMSSWKVAKVYKAMFKWLSDKIDIFSVNGVKFDTLQSIYKSVTVSVLVLI
jgi:hypothetical protein